VSLVLDSSATLAWIYGDETTDADAAYLELARRRSLPLATLDAALVRAATPLGVGVLGG